MDCEKDKKKNRIHNKKLSTNFVTLKIIQQ